MTSSSNQRPAKSGFRSVLQCAMPSFSTNFPPLSAPEPPPALLRLPESDVHYSFVLTDASPASSINGEDAVDSVLKYQQQLLEQVRFKYCDTSLSRRTEEAFLAVPRHLFVNRYRMIGTK